MRVTRLSGLIASTPPANVKSDFTNKSKPGARGHMAACRFRLKGVGWGGGAVRLYHSRM